MRKLFLSILAAGTVAVASAQEGTLLVYGNLGYNSNTDAAKTKTNTFMFNPGVGYQFNSMWTAGLDLNMNNQSQTPDGGKTSKDNAMHIGVFGRYTKPLNNIFALYAQLTVASQSENYDDGKGNTVKYTGIWAGVTPAVSIHIPGWFEMNVSFGGLSYETMKSNASGANTASTVDFNFGQTVNIGLSKNFNLQKKMKGHHEPGEDTRKMNTSDDDDDAPKAKKHKKSKKSKSDDED
jgi:hypothetical protein